MSSCINNLKSGLKEITPKPHVLNGVLWHSHAFDFSTDRQQILLSFSHRKVTNMYKKHFSRWRRQAVTHFLLANRQNTILLTLWPLITLSSRPTSINTKTLFQYLSSHYVSNEGSFLDIWYGFSQDSLVPVLINLEAQWGNTIWNKWRDMLYLNLIYSICCI